MPFKSLKNKINNLASGEILGDTTEEIERKESERSERKEKERKEKPEKASPEKKKKEKPVKEPKEKKSPAESFFKRRSAQVEVEEEEVEVQRAPKKEPEKTKIRPKESVPGYEEVLGLLGIREKVDLEVDFESKDLDYIEFSQTTPLGFDFEEVTDFISRMKYILNKHENLARQRDKEIVILASEVKKVENKMVESKQATEMERMMGGMTEEERLIEENMDLRVELNKLKANSSKFGNPEEMENLMKQIELLKAENQVLSMKLVGKAPQESKNTGLPSGIPPMSAGIPPMSSGLPTMEPPATQANKNAGLPSFEGLSGNALDITEIEEDFTLDPTTLMNMGKRTTDPVENMLKDIGGNYDE